MVINDNISFLKLKAWPGIGENYKYINFMPGALGTLMNRVKVKRFAKVWNVESIVAGLSAFAEVAAKGDYLYRLYTDTEIAEDKSKKDPNVIYLPAKDKGEGKPEKPFVILCAGGAYSSVCTAVEGFPVAARLNELGYDVFCLTYRVGEKGILPKPIDDLARAVKFILGHREVFKVSDEYIVGGFSAGGNLVSLWGTENNGYLKYDLPKPKALFPIYPVTTAKIGDNKVLNACLVNMYGKNPPADLVDKYEVPDHVSAAYPPSYIVCCADDATVPPENSKLLKEALEKAGVPCSLEIGEKGNHGFGEGRGTSVEGWIDRAVAFVEAL